MHDSNPWVAASTSRKHPDAPLSGQIGQLSEPERSLAHVAHPPVTGAELPQSAIDFPTTGALPTRAVAPIAEVWVVGAHGGAGESSLASLDPAWESTGHAWPQAQGAERPCATVLVARTNLTGLVAAQKALTQWASGALSPSVRLLGLVLMADAPGRLPKPLREMSALVAGGAPRVWNVAWVEAWRLGAELDAAQLPKSLRRLTQDLSVLSGSSLDQNHRM